MRTATLIHAGAIVAFAFAATAALAGGVYRWTDAQGKVHYTDEPPPSTKATEVTDRINSYSGTPTVAERRGGAVASGVVMYSTAWCAFCKKARAYFQQEGIRFAERDVEISAAANVEYKRLGGRGVPLIVVGSQVMTGFSEKRFEDLLAKSKS